MVCKNFSFVRQPVVVRPPPLSYLGSGPGCKRGPGPQSAPGQTGLDRGAGSLSTLGRGECLQSGLGCPDHTNCASSTSPFCRSREEGTGRG